MDDKWRRNLKYAGYGLLAAGAVALSFIRSPVKKAGRPAHYLDLANKTAIITGASKGIGYHTAENLARFDMRVILACRNLDEGEIAAEKIRKSVKNPNIVAMQCDMSSFESIRSFAKLIHQHESQVTALVNNAAVLLPDEQYTKDGLESQMGVNYFGHFLLTNLLLPKMTTSSLQSNSRIVNVTSIFAKYGHLKFDDLAGEYYAGHKLGHFSSKLALSLFTMELSKRFQHHGINALAVDPRLSRTQLGRHVQLPLKEKAMFFITAVSARQGAHAVADAVINQNLSDETGTLFHNCRRKNWPPEIVEAAKDSEKLWEASEAITKLHEDSQQEVEPLQKAAL